MVEYLPKFEDYQLKTVIGNGCANLAKVWLAEHLPSGSPVAVKTMKLDNTIDLNLLQNEVHMNRILQHPNILQSHCVFTHGQQIWQAMPLMAYGSCRDLIQAHFSQGLPEEACAYILRDVLQALDYLHQQGVIHRGLRASHILISASGEVKLSGFRHAHPMICKGQKCKVIHDFPRHYVQSLLWASPELLEQNMAGYDTKSDIYSVGITACELANGIIPFSDVPFTQMLLEKTEGVTPQLVDCTTVPELAGEGICGENGQMEESADGTSSGRSPRRFSSHFHELVSLCLQTDPKIRPSAASLLQHSFFKQVKRRSTVESLPDLLQPVCPITQIPDLPSDGASEEITSQMQSLSMENTLWDFSQCSA